MSVKKIKVDTLTYGPVSVWYDDDLDEYQVRVQGLRGSTYYTSDREDALATASLLESDRLQAIARLLAIAGLFEASAQVASKRQIVHNRQIACNRQIVHNRLSREGAE